MHIIFIEKRSEWRYRPPGGPYGGYARMARTQSLLQQIRTMGKRLKYSPGKISIQFIYLLKSKHFYGRLTPILTLTRHV